MSSIVSVLRDAFATARRNPLTYVGLVTVPLIAALFGLLYVNVFMDPYEKMRELPVAVVNLDEGVPVDDAWKNYGDELVEAIQKDDSALWTIEGPELIESGIENSEYYMAVVIPADFSERVAAGQTSSPKTARITFFSNMRKNFMLSTLSSKMETALHETVNAKIGAQYGEALAEGLYDAKEGFSDAVDGAGQLNDGTSELAAGASALSGGAGELASGLGELASGSGELAGGLDELDRRLNGSSGTTLMEAASSVETGAKELKEGIGVAKEASSAVAAGAQSVNSGLANAEDAARNLESGIVRIIAQWRAGTLPAEAAMAAIETNLLPAAESHALSEGISRARSALDGSGGSGDGNIAGAAHAVETGLAHVEEALGDSDTPDTLLFGIHSVTDGIGSVASAVEGAAVGARQLRDGGLSLADGASSLNAGTSALDNGAAQLDEGVASLQEGLIEGHAAIDESLTATPAEYGDYLVAPVEMEEDVFGNLSAFGYGFAPLFLTLCLWLGSLLLFFIFDPFPSKNMEYAGRFAAVFGRWPLYLMLVALNVAAAAVGAGLSGVPNAASGQFLLLLACVGFSFFSILQLFSLFDIPGKALAIVVLIVQVVCCSGTFPSVLGEGFASDVSPFLPFTYAIDGMRACMSGVDPGAILSDETTLMLFAVASALASVALYPLALRMKQKHDVATIKALTLAHADPRHAGSSS